MKKLVWIGFVSFFSAVVFYAQTAKPSGQPSATAASQRELVDKYCVTCHNTKVKTGGLALDKLDLAHVVENAEVWEKAVRKLRAGMMPPLGLPRPAPAAYDGLAEWLENELDRAAAAKPSFVPPGIHRVNRTEYANAVRDLLSLEIDPAEFLPVDDSSYGFDNVAGSLGISPALVEGYMSAAGKISRLAVGHETAPSQKKYIAPQDYSQETHLEGLPFGTRGGMLINHYFPADGEYLISWFPVRGNTGELYGSERKDEHLEVLLDGERVKLFDIAKIPNGTDNDKNETRLQVRAGAHKVGLAFLATTDVPMDDLNQHNVRSVLDTNPIPGYIFSPQVSQVIIMGPYSGKRPQDTPSRRKVFVCQPAAGADEVPCAKKILSNLATQAYRRPVSEGDLESLLSVYQKARNKGDFEDGIQLALQDIVADPEFIFRSESDPANVKPGQAYHINDLELASRLSFFLWSSTPDSELIGLASQGKLHDPKVLEQQTRRMLTDQRSHELVKNFAGQWLQLRNLPSTAPITQMFPDFDDNLRQAFRTETEMFFESILRDNRSTADLLNADYTFVNERLARHYGIPNVYGSHFRRVTLNGELENRRGLLGKGAIELVTSVADRTSPVLRGKWVLMNILGVIPPDPPPNVPPLRQSDKMANGQPVPLEISMRERMEEHRANAVCASCHKMMDPIGFALENFDAVGKWRTEEFGRKLDVAGQLSDGSKVNGPAGLRDGLTRYSPQFVRVVTEKLLTYALGRGVEYQDMPVVRSIIHEAAPGNYRLSSLVVGIVKSAPFQMNVRVDEAASTPRQTASVQRGDQSVDH
jgi:mono/diheme cytochrome c family protein